MDAERLFELAPCGYAVIDGEGRIVAANAELHRLAGRAPGTLAGQEGLASLLSVGGRIYLETHLLPVLEHDHAVREVSLDLLRPDGTRIPVLMNATVDRTVGSQVRCVFVETRDRHRYEQDLLEATRAAERAREQATALAQTLQQTLIPPAPPEIPHLEIAATYRPAGDGTMVGGDFYDIFRLDVDSWFVVLGDVSGKGVSAAAITSFVRYTVRALAIDHPDPADLLHRLDRALRVHRTRHYCTVAVAHLTDRSDGSWTVRLGLGGHPPPLLAGAEGAVRELGHYGSAVGLVDDAHFHTVEHVLRDETLLLYTDGVTEARSDDGMYGEQRLADLVTSLGRAPETLAHGIAEAVLDFQGGRASDDIAIVALAPTGAAASVPLA